MDESCKTDSVEASLENQRRENIFPVSGLDSALIIGFAWKKRRPVVNIYVNSWAMENVMNADQSLKNKRRVRQGILG